MSLNELVNEADRHKPDPSQPYRFECAGDCDSVNLRVRGGKGQCMQTERGQYDKKYRGLWVVCRKCGTKSPVVYDKKNDVFKRVQSVR